MAASEQTDPGTHSGAGAPAASEARAASLVVVEPGGHRSTIYVQPTPFRIGRQADNNLVLRDNRASRNHARIVAEGGDYWIEDLVSRHGTFVNGSRILRHKLEHSDRIEFGLPDSYSLVFLLEGKEIARLMDMFSTTTGPAPGQLSRLRAVTEVARALETSLTVEDVLRSLVQAALAVTGTERGFLLMHRGEELDMRVACDKHGVRLAETDLRVPRRLIRRALAQRRELLVMNFSQDDEGAIERSVADLDLRSVVCVPLVRIRVGASQETTPLTAAANTTGVLYMDSRIGHADLSAGNRELLQTLALEASTVLENARLLEEARASQKIEEELNLARLIQRSLFPKTMPKTGWFRATGSSMASAQVGGDYFDVIPLGPDAWGAVVADVAGKGVGSALLACYLQGALSAATLNIDDIGKVMGFINRFLAERAGGEKYATLFCCGLGRDGRLRYINAGHCAPVLVTAAGEMRVLDATGFPVGLIPDAEFPAEELRLAPGDRLIVYSDGVTESRAPAGAYYGTERLSEVIGLHLASSCEEMHDAILRDVQELTAGAPQADDITLLVIEFERS